MKKLKQQIAGLEIRLTTKEWRKLLAAAESFRMTLGEYLSTQVSRAMKEAE